MPEEKITLPHTSNLDSHHEQKTGEASPTILGDSQSAEHADVVGFRNEGKFLSTQMDNPSEDLSLTQGLRPSEEERHSIASFLSRPVKIATISWTTQQQVGQRLGVYDILTEINNKNFAIMRNKISGFYGMHATANLKILVNAQPYQQGLLQIYYIPFARTFPTFSPFQDKELILPFTTGCPNTIINLATQTGGVLSVPYTGPNAFIHIPSMINNKRDWGTFYVQNISSIQDSTNSAKAQISVYLYFTNVKLFGATSKVWKPQMDRGAEEYVKRSGPISTVLKPTVNKLAKALPEVLDALGLSKPVANQNPSRVVVNPFGNFALTNSTSTALKVSATEQQAVSIGKLGVDNCDEMDIVKIISKPCYYTKATWKTSNPVGSEILHLTVNPNCVLTDNFSGQYTMCAPTRLRYIANLFKFWRGDIIYTFHIAGTKFHSGRMRLVYNIGAEMNNNELGETLPYVFSQVIDIRDGMTFDVVCPYFCSTPWREVPRFWNTNLHRFTADHVDDYDDMPNILSVYVENELMTSPSTADEVKIIVMVRGAPNMQFAGLSTSRSLPATITTGSRKKREIVPPDLLPPVDPLARPDTGSKSFYTPATMHMKKDFFTIITEKNFYDYYPTTTPASTEQENPDTETPAPEETTPAPEPAEEPAAESRVFLRRLPLFKPQSDCDMPTVNMVSLTDLKSIQFEDSTTMMIGEKIDNLRPLTRRYFQVGMHEIAAQETYTFLLFPFAMIEPLVGPKGNTAFAVEFLHYISYLYRFYRGGIRHMIKTNADPYLVTTLKYDTDVRTSLNNYNLNPDKYPFGLKSPIFKISSDYPRENFSSVPYAVTQPGFPTLTGGIEFEVPYYSKTHKLPVQKVPNDFETIIESVNDAEFPEGVVVFSLDTKASARANHLVEHYRAAADDFNFGYLLGAPLTTIQVLFFPK